MQLVQLVELLAYRKNARVVGLRMAVCLVDHLVYEHLRRTLVQLALLHLALGQLDEAALEVVERQRLGVAAEHDIGTTACHVGGDGDGAVLAGLRNDIRLALMMLRVQHGVLDALCLEDLGQLLGLLDRDRTDQDRLALGVAFLDARNDRVDLAALVLVYGIRVVLANDRLVGRDLDDIELIGVAELLLLGQRGTGHAGQLAVQAEVVLEGDGREGLALVLDLDALLRLDGLMQTLVVAAAEHQTAGELIDNDDLAVTDNIVHIALHDAARLDSLIDIVLERGVLRVGQVLDLEVRLGALLTVRRKGRGLCLLVDDVIRLDVVLLLLRVNLLDTQALEADGEAVRDLVHLRGLLALTGNDQRRARLVDQNGVDLVDDRERMAALHHRLLVDRHVVAQVVEAELVVRAVGDVRSVHRLACLRRNLMDDQTDVQTEEAVDLAHPLAVALCEVVVDGYDVDALAGQRVQIGRQRRHEGLALAGLHLRDTALMQDDAADDLDAVVTHAEHAPRSLAAGRKSLGQQLVERLAVLIAFLKFIGLCAQLLIGELPELLLQRFDLIRNGVDLLQLMRGMRAEDLGKKVCHYLYSAFQKGIAAPFVHTGLLYHIIKDKQINFL